MENHSAQTRARRSTRKPSQQSYYEESELEDDEFDEEENPELNYAENAYFSHFSDARSKQKRRKLQDLVSSHDFASRPGSKLPGSSRSGDGGSREDWTEEESFVLLEIWGEKFLELGRRSLRGEDWVEVAEKVSEMGGAERTEMECRTQMEVLKNKYKKEIAKMEQMGGRFMSKWVFFKKMDVLLNLKMKSHCGLGCGVDSGEYVFMDPQVYLSRSNLLDEMRDSPRESDDDNEDEDEQDDRGFGGEEDDGESAKLLAESIQRFGEIYEKIENGKRKQMVELEKMRSDFQRELDLQKKQIIESAQAEIARLRERDGSEDEDEDDDDDEDEHDVVQHRTAGGDSGY